MHIIKYRRYPNNEVRAVHYYSAPPRESKGDFDVTSNVTSSPEGVSESDGEVEVPPSLNLTLATNSASGDSILPFRKTKFGRNAKNTLLRIGGAYDTLSTKPDNFVFLTGTLPGNTPTAFRVLAEYSSCIAESIGRWIQRTVKSEYYFYTWELQKRGALHFHYCVYCPDAAAKEKILSGFKPKWTSLLDDISARSGVCLWEGNNGTCWLDRYGTLQAYAQPVHTSVAAYLSGYLAGDKDKHAQDENSPYYPRRWWGASRRTTALLKSLTEEITVEHNNYRGAALEIRRFYETVLHETPHAYMYNHKVGVGSTVTSYHPEDKGLSIWQGLQKMTLHHKHHPHIASLILAVKKLAVMVQPYMKSSSKRRGSGCDSVLLNLQDSSLWTTLGRWTLQDTHLRILRTAKSHLPSHTQQDHHLLEVLRVYQLMEDFLTLNEGLLKFNQYGWLSNVDDLPYTVDWKKQVSYFSTNEPEGSDTREGMSLASSKAHQLPLPL